MNIEELSSQVLRAFTGADLTTASRLLAANVVIYGTDREERWQDRTSFMAALDAMRALGLSATWEQPVVTGPDWVAGVALYRSRGGALTPVRVTMVFCDGQLVHGHFSVETSSESA